MITTARPTTENGAHFYTRDGQPLYEILRKDGSGMRPFTLADARKMTPSPLPSVTTILSILRKPQLETWLQEQACLAVLTTPQIDGEPLDKFVERVLHTERHQDQESDVAKKRGTEIHDAIEAYFSGRDSEVKIAPLWDWIGPAIKFLEEFGEVHHCEHILVSKDGYAGRCDLIQETLPGFHVWDFKTTKNLPTKGAWTEHIIQASAYAKAFGEQFDGTPAAVAPGITTGNIYISTVERGKFVVCEHPGDYFETYHGGFKPLLDHWKWSNSYHP